MASLTPDLRQSASLFRVAITHLAEPTFRTVLPASLAIRDSLGTAEIFGASFVEVVDGRLEACRDVDLTKLIAMRSELKEQYKQQGVKLTMMPFFIKALSLAIKQFPVLNSQVNDDCSELTYFDDHNIGMAVDSKIGLLVPNIKSCQSKSIVDVANEVTRLTEAARDGRVSPDDLKGGTISISNIGAIGGTIATPIINKPEVAIVALGKLQHLPRFDAQGNVVSAAIMQVSWSGDHRVIDGALGAQLLNQCALVPQ